MRGTSLTRTLTAALTVALAVGALIALAPGTAEAAAVPCQRTYSTGALHIGITPDAFSDLDVPEDGLVVTDVDATLNLQRPDLGDLTVSLNSYSQPEPNPDPFVEPVGFRGRSYLFGGWSGAGGPDLTGTVLDDQAATPISWGNAPYVGRFKPTTPLAPLNGATGGFYRLAFRVPPASVGTLLGWSITLRYQSCDFDSDGVEDHADRCLGVSAHTATGCPLTTRSLTTTYGSGRFSGKLSSPVAGCKAFRAVSVWKVRTGPDLKLGTVTTRPDGIYRLARAKRAGRYYATSQRMAVTGVAECPAVKSLTFRIL